MKKLTKVIASGIVALGLVFGGAGAASAAVPAKSTVVKVTTWPKSTSNLSPAWNTSPGFYHNGKKTVVTTSKCTSGRAEQGTFYRFTVVDRSYRVLFNQPLYLIKCLP